MLVLRSNSFHASMSLCRTLVLAGRNSRQDNTRMCLGPVGYMKRVPRAGNHSPVHPATNVTRRSLFVETSMMS